MREERDGIWCVASFGKNWQEALQTAIEEGSLTEDTMFDSVCNPIPTGDHWKAIAWADAYSKKGNSSLTKVPRLKRDFARKAGDILSASRGFCMEIASKAARTYRDDNDLRMLRGNVYLFVGRGVKDETLQSG